MSYLIPLTKSDYDLALLRPGAPIETRKGKKVQIVWTPTGYQGFVIFEQSRIFLVWDKLGRCISYACDVANKDYDLFYRVYEDKPSLIYAVTVKATCQTNALLSFNLDKYMSGGYELETRNGFKIPALEFTGDEKKVFRGADNMRHLRWTRTGKINANGVEHELDLMMRKVKK